VRSDQLQRYRRIITTFARRATLSRMGNLLAVETARLLRLPPPRSSGPYTLVVDPFNTCNLRCPLCTTGSGHILPRENRMSLENYTRLIDPIHRNLFGVFLYNWSEPFLNPALCDIIRYTTDLNIATFVSSNLSLAIDADALGRSGLDHLIISGDGITQEVYESYRRGGNLDRVLSNLTAIAAAKKRLNSPTPTIEWQCLVNRFNEGQLELIKETVLAAGANEVRFANLNFFSSEDPEADSRYWLPQSPRWRHFSIAAPPPDGTRRIPCHWLWRSAVINCDGTVSPCCLYDVKGWGNGLDTSFPEIWHGETYRAARTLEKIGDPCPDAAAVCGRCTAPFIVPRSRV